MIDDLFHEKLFVDIIPIFLRRWWFQQCCYLFKEMSKIFRQVFNPFCALVFVHLLKTSENGILTDSLNAIYCVFGIIDIGICQIPNMETYSLNIIESRRETRQKRIIRFITVDIFLNFAIYFFVFDYSALFVSVRVLLQHLWINFWFPILYAW